MSGVLLESAGPSTVVAQATCPGGRWLHPHRQACCSEPFVRDSRLLWQETIRTMDWIYSKNTPGTCVIQFLKQMSGRRKEDAGFVTFTAASTYAAGRGVILSWLQRQVWKPETDSSRPAKVSLEGKDGGALLGLAGAGRHYEAISGREATPTTSAQGNLDRRDGRLSVPFWQVEFAGATYCPRLTANFSNSWKLLHNEITLWNRDDYELQITFRKWPRMSK